MQHDTYIQKNNNHFNKEQNLTLKVLQTYIDHGKWINDFYEYLKTSWHI